MYKVFNKYYGTVNSWDDFYGKAKDYFACLGETLTSVGISDYNYIYFGDSSAVNVSSPSVATQYNFPSWICDIYNGLKPSEVALTDGYPSPIMDKSSQISYWSCDGVGYAINCYHFRSSSYAITCYSWGSVVIGSPETACFGCANPRYSNSNSPFVAGDRFANISILRREETKEFLILGDNRNLKYGFTMGHTPIVGVDGIERIYSITTGELANKPQGDYSSNLLIASSISTTYSNMYSDVRGDIINGGKLALFDIGLGLEKGGYLGKLSSVYAIPKTVNSGELININGEMFLGVGFVFFRRALYSSYISSFNNKVVMKC